MVHTRRVIDATRALCIVHEFVISSKPPFDTRIWFAIFVVVVCFLLLLLLLLVSMQFEWQTCHPHQNIIREWAEHDA